MVDITPGVGLSFAQGTHMLKIGDSLNRVITLLQEHLSVFGTIKVVIPPSDKKVASSDVWIYLL